MKAMPNKKRQFGMTFIEVLVALFILVTGVLGAVAMQASVKKGSFDAMQRSLASALAQDIVDKMRSNDPLALAGYVRSDYGVALDAVPASRCRTVAAICTPAEMVINDRYEWEAALMGANVLQGASNAGGLVGARGCITSNLNSFTVVVSWQGRVETSDDPNANVCGIAGDKRRQVIVEAFIY
ncbi:type IV pilus modification protein PilV [Colwelliaceae bacterium 6441]